MWKLIPASLLMLSAMGCATYRAPQGEDAATLKVAVRNLGITIVDGEATCSVIRVEGVPKVRLSSGKHSIHAIAMLGGYFAEGDLWFVAVPHGEYELQYRLKDMRVAFWIVDTSTELPVGGVKGSDDEPPDSTDGPENRPHGPALPQDEV